MTRTKRATHVFEKRDGKFINPSTNSPWKHGERYNDLMFVRHRVDRPEFRKVDSSKASPLCFQKDFVQDDTSEVWINPLTKNPLKYGDIIEDRVFIRYRKTKQAGLAHKVSPEFLSIECFEKRKQMSSGQHRSINRVATALLADAKKRAKKRNAVVTLTQEWILKKIQGTCELTGLPFTFGVQDKSRNGQSPSLDRIDVQNPNQTEENTRVVLDYVNSALNVFSLQDSAIILRKQLDHLETKANVVRTQISDSVE